MITVLSIIGYGVLCLIALLLVILLIPVFVRVTYQEDLHVCVRFIGIAVYRYPSDKPSKAAKSESDKPNAALSDLSERLKRDSVGETVRLCKQLADLAVSTVRRLLRTVTVDKLYLAMFIAGSDAAQTAQKTGQVCAVLYPAVTAAQQTVLRIKRREITVTPDFLAENGRVTADITAHVIPLFAVCIALWTLTRYGAITKRNKEVPCHGKQSTESDGPVDR
ncbi:MAG: hypothetical protein IJP14_06315 [Clostridia bacterium]|nr:hypothetical protein [Clostridia bacterium]